MHPCFYRTCQCVTVNVRSLHHGKHASGSNGSLCDMLWISFISWRSLDSLFTRRHSGTCKYIVAVTYHLGTGRIAIVSLWRPGCPAPSNKREAAGACHGNLTTLRGFACGAFCGHDSSQCCFNQSSFYNRKTYLYWQKHYDITNSWWSLIAVGEYYWQIFDKLVKAMDVKVSTKRWRDRSQTPIILYPCK